MKKCVYLLLLVLPLSSTAMDQEDARALFEQANVAYESESYLEAFQLYDSVATAFRSFELCYNAGNAAFRSGQLGASILYYERARKIAPTDDDLQVNLTIANEKVVDRIQELPSLGVDNLWNVLTATRRLPLWTWLALIGNLLGFGLLIAWLFSNGGTRKRVLFFGGASLIFIAFLFYGLSHVSFARLDAGKEAIIMIPKVDVKNSPNADDRNAFILHEGTKVKVMGENEDWLEIRIANGSVGWVHSTSLERI